MREIAHPSQSFPINFIIEREQEEFINDDVDSHPQRYHTTRECWILQTAQRLRALGWHGIEARPALLSGAINVATNSAYARTQLVHYRDGPTIRLTVVADDRLMPPGDVRIVQSPQQAMKHSRSHWICHWPQPGLLPRGNERGHQIETVLMPGAKMNFVAAGNSESLANWAIGTGVLMQWAGPETWHDYRKADLVLALRNETGEIVAHKPPSKLINGWRAGVPVIAGPEISYRFVGRPGENYLEVRNLREAREAIVALQNDPDKYQSLVEGGKRAATRYSEERIAEQWRDLFRIISASSDTFGGYLSAQQFLAKSYRLGNRLMKKLGSDWLVR
jgi:hypothetical protein